MEHNYSLEARKNTDISSGFMTLTLINWTEWETFTVILYSNHLAKDKAELQRPLLDPALAWQQP